MRFLLQSIVLTPLLLCSVLFAAPDTTKYAHAKILGKLLYTDLSLSCDEQPVSQVLHQFQDDLNIDMFVFWKSKDKDGIDKSTPITLKLTNQPAIVVLERIIEKLNNTAPTAWQLRDSMLEIGFKERITEGSAMELRTYDVMNLMFTIRDFDNAPTMGTTGGGGVNFGDPTDDPNRLTKNEEAEQLINTITDFIESEQWKVHGGNCTIRFYKGSLLVKAPDFVHRQLGGYPFAPLKPKNMKKRNIY